MLSVTELRSMLGSGGQAATGAGTFSAIVTRVDADGTTWCQVDGSTTPTPCATDMACSVGDVVTVRIADHRATVTGNATSPATDDSAANAAQFTATVAQGTAKAAGTDASIARQAASAAARQAGAANAAASEASALANATNQHFWQDSDGASVTEQTQDEYVQQPTGWRKLLKSTGELLTHAVNGVERIFRSDTASGTLFFDGECAPDASDLEDHVLAAFTTDGVRVGRKSGGNVTLSANTAALLGQYGNVMLEGAIIDWELGNQTITVDFAVPSNIYLGPQQIQLTSLPSSADSISVVAILSSSGGTYPAAFDYDADENVVSIDYTTQPAVEELGRQYGMRLSYVTNHRLYPCIRSGFFTKDIDYHGDCSISVGNEALAQGNSASAFGEKVQATGSYAHAEGWKAYAGGQASHAEGYQSYVAGRASHGEGRETTAQGNYAHAEGYGTSTASTSTAQHVQGKFNEILSSDYADIIGNGTSDIARSNCHATKWDGTQEVNGSTDLPIFKYSSLPAESSLPLKPCIVVLATGEVYLAT